VDLRLKTLPAGLSSGGITLPASSDSQLGTGGTINGQPGSSSRSGWRPRGDAGDAITGKLKEVKEERFPLDRVGRDEYLFRGPQFSARILPDGSVTFEDKTVRDFNGTSGSFDVTDMLMRGRKQDPYRYEKQQFLASTQALRDQLTRKARQERHRATLDELALHLEQLWADGRRSPERRRQQLCELWRDTASGDDDDGKEGAAVRKMVVSFVRSRLPAGSVSAFTSDELTACSRAGKERFAPYE
jgi:hypothetical protein